MSGERSTVAWQRARARVLAEESSCWLCGRTDFVREARHPHSRSVDHVVPLSRGGALLERSNLRLACFGCNSARGAGPWLPTRSEDW